MIIKLRHFIWIFVEIFFQIHQFILSDCFPLVCINLFSRCIEPIIPASMPGFYCPTHIYQLYTGFIISILKDVVKQYQLIMMSKVAIVFLWIICIHSQSHELCNQSNLSERELLTLSLDCFRKRYDPDRHDGSTLSTIIKERLMSYKSTLHKLKMDSVELIKTTPVIKWAQNIATVFINFKLSHRHDSPPCSHLKFEYFSVINAGSSSSEFEIQNKLDANRNFSSFSFFGECYFTDQKFLFNLELDFHSLIKDFQIEKEGFGSYTIIANKNQEGIWINPFEGVKKAAIWTQFRQKYSQDMDSYFTMRQEEHEKNQVKKSKRRRKKQRKSSTQEVHEENQKDETKTNEDL